MQMSYTLKPIETPLGRIGQSGEISPVDPNTLQRVAHFYQANDSDQLISDVKMPIRRKPLKTEDTEI